MGSWSVNRLLRRTKSGGIISRADTAAVVVAASGLLHVSSPRWPVGNGILLESGRSGVRIPLAPGFVRVDTSDFKTGTPLVTLPGVIVIGSVLGLVGAVSVYCDCVRWKVGSAERNIVRAGPSQRYTSLLLGR